MDFFKKHLFLFIFGAAIIAALLFYLLNIPNSKNANIVEKTVLNIFYPVIKPLSAISDSINHLTSNYINLVDVKQDNAKLSAIVKEQNNKLIAAEENLLQNERLKKLLQMKKGIKENSIAATVIGDDTTAWFHTIVIDRGLNDSISEAMPVISAEGVVGQVVKLGSNSSRVMLLTDHASGIAATIQRSRARGVVKGRGKQGCVLEFVGREEDIKVGDVVITSGIGGVFPKGIPIGEVKMVKRGEYGVFQNIEIKPFANISHLEELLIITGVGM